MQRGCLTLPCHSVCQSSHARQSHARYDCAIMQGIHEMIVHHACRAFILQDHLYLDTYAAMLNTLAAKSSTRAQAAFFTASAQQVVSEEMQMQDKLLQSWNVSEATAQATELTPSALLYVSYLRATALDRPFHEGMPAMYMCSIPQVLCFVQSQALCSNALRSVNVVCVTGHACVCIGAPLDTTGCKSLEHHAALGMQGWERSCLATGCTSRLGNTSNAKGHRMQGINSGSKCTGAMNLQPLCSKPRR